MPADTPGLSADRPERKMGLTGSHTTMLRFDGVRVYGPVEDNPSPQPRYDSALARHSKLCLEVRAYACNSFHSVMALYILNSSATHMLSVKEDFTGKP